jgi:hypothetical protein
MNGSGRVSFGCAASKRATRVVWVELRATHRESGELAGLENSTHTAACLRLGGESMPPMETA